MNNWSEEDKELFKRMISAVKKGYYLSGKEITNLYNRVLEKALKPTNCASCIRQRYNELRKWYDINEKANNTTINTTEEPVIDDAIINQDIKVKKTVVKKSVRKK